MQENGVVHSAGWCIVVLGGANCCGRMRSGAKRWRISSCKIVHSLVGAGTGPCGGERPPGMPGAAVHRHILYRMNAINDSLKKKKKAPPVSDSEHSSAEHVPLP